MVTILIAHYQTPSETSLQCIFEIAQAKYDDSGFELSYTRHSDCLQTAQRIKPDHVIVLMSQDAMFSCKLIETLWYDRSIGADKVTIHFTTDLAPLPIFDSCGRRPPASVLWDETKKLSKDQIN